MTGRAPPLRARRTGPPPDTGTSSTGSPIADSSRPTRSANVPTAPASSEGDSMDTKSLSIRTISSVRALAQVSRSC